MENFVREDIRPRWIEKQAIVQDSIVQQNILPQPLPRRIIGPAPLRYGPRPLVRRAQFDSTIFLPPLPVPSLIHGANRDDWKWQPAPNHRRTLGW